VAYYIFNFTKKGAQLGIPLRDQAAELLEAGLWAIGPSTANRGNLKPGDTALIHVGAPERDFIGVATLGSENHPWSQDEQDRYPASLNSGSGVSFSSATIWEQPIPIMAVWPSCPSSSTNPSALFFGGVTRILEADYQAILEATGASTSVMSFAERPTSEQLATPPTDAGIGVSTDEQTDDLFKQVQLLHQHLESSAGQKISEQATRTNFIDPVIKALGYDLLTDVDYEVTTAGNDAADFVLSVNGRPHMVIEAKPLDAKLEAKHASQVAKYTTSMGGARWAVVTNGRAWRIYDSDMQGVSPEERLILEIDLASTIEPEEFAVKVAPLMLLLSRQEALDGTNGLEQISAREAIRETLLDADSDAVASLTAELKNRRKLHLTNEEIATINSELLGS
jgi:predicted type IV restriction endonuclease